MGAEAAERGLRGTTFVELNAEVGGLLGASYRPMLNRRTEFARVYEHSP